MYEDASGTRTSIMNSFCHSLEEDVPFGHLSKMGNHPELQRSLSNISYGIVERMGRINQAMTGIYSRVFGKHLEFFPELDILEFGEVDVTKFPRVL
jgi:hypothetical protein